MITYRCDSCGREVVNKDYPESWGYVTLNYHSGVGEVINLVGQFNVCGGCATTQDIKFNGTSYSNNSRAYNTMHMLCVTHARATGVEATE